MFKGKLSFFFVLILISEALALNVTKVVFPDALDNTIISLKKTPHFHESEVISYMSAIQDSIHSFSNCK